MYFYQKKFDVSYVVKYIIFMKTENIITLFNALCEEIEGDWLLVGGALLNVLGISQRVTLDIDLIPMQEATNKEQLHLMDIAVKHNFPPEVINFSAEYFVKKIKNWEKQVILLKKGTKGNIYRPTKKLFKRMKESRGTETDLNDITLFEKRIKE
jgi:hypothetical protein